MRQNGKEEISKKLYKDIAQKQRTWFSSCKWLITSSVQQMKQNQKWIAKLQVRLVLLKYFSSVQISSSVVSNSLRPHESQHTRPPCPLPTPGVYSNSCPSSWWCHPAISSSVIPFSSCPQSLPASGSFPMSQLFSWGGQSIEILASASIVPMNSQDWSPLGWTGWISNIYMYINHWTSF